MEIIQSKWQVKVNFNKVQIIGTAPSINSFINKIVENIMITKVVEYIDRAEKMAECVILSEEPQELNDMNKAGIMVSFSVMFKSPIKANEYARSINN